MDPNFSSTYTQSYNSYSGTDMKALISIPAGDGRPPIARVLGNLQTISYSIFREKYPVRALGHVGEKGRTRGGRTIAGSMVFTVFDRHVLLDFLRQHPGDPAITALNPQGLADLSNVMVDQMPQFDVVIQFCNEYGYASELVIMGVEISAEGQVMSMEDLITENTCQYTASHMTLMRPGGYLEPKEYPSDFKDTFHSIMNKEASPFMEEIIRKTRNPFR